MKLAIRILILFFLAHVHASNACTEAAYNDKYCAQIDGQREVRHYYTVDDKRQYIVVDCETKGEVIEGGLDKRSSLDSLQQVLFAAALTDKQPRIIIYDANKKNNVYEHRIKTAARSAGVAVTISPERC